MVEHCHLEFTQNPDQQYSKPPIRFNSEEAAIIDGEIQKLLSNQEYAARRQKATTTSSLKNGSCT